MKKALILAYNEGKRQGIDFAFVGNIHDELQAEVRQDQTHQFGEIMAQAIVDAGEFFNMRCPMAGKYEVGNSWANTH